MPVLPARSLVFAFPARLFVCIQLPNGDLMDRVVVHRICFALSRCPPLFLRLLPLFFVLGALGGGENVFLPRLEVGGLSSPRSDVIIENSRLRQKGDPF